MLNFANDYLEGAHEKVLDKLIESNRQAEMGYGADRFTQEAIERIKAAINFPQATVQLIAGGTQTNLLVIDTLLAPYEGVLAPETGHIATHEAGAIERTGHKVLTLSAKEGKITAKQVEDYLSDFYADGNHEHAVFPGMVYISYPTEYGTLYSKAELQSLQRVCRAYAIPLFIDGARLGYGLASPEADVTIEDIANLSDVFYIGGTKVGALLGEAVVYTHAQPPRQLTARVKQHGALLAKGRVLGAQFLALFEENLYFDIARHGVDLALQIKAALVEKGYQLYLDSPTNQQFVILSNDQYQVLSQQINFSFWEKDDADHTVVRIATSWSTRQADVDALIALL